MERSATEAINDRVRALVYVSVADVIFYLALEDGDRFRFVEINPAFTRATGLSKDQVVGRLVDEVIPEPSLSLVLAKYREAISERRTVRWEEVTEYPSGRKYGEVSVTPVLDDAGRCAGLVGTVHDVTDVRARDEVVRQYAELVRAVQIGLTVWHVADPDAPGGVTLAGFNPEAARMAGADLAARVGCGLPEVFPDPAGASLRELLCAVARDGAARELASLRQVDPRGARTVAAKAFPLQEHRVGLALEDITPQARARALIAVEKSALEMVASGATLADTLATLARAIEEHAPPAIASVLLLSADGARLLYGAGPGLPDAYNRAIDGALIGPLAGSCGAAAALRQQVIVTDTERDPKWAEYRELARQHGLRACWSSPIIASDGRVLGTFALYYREPRAPSPEDLELIARATHVAGIAIERHQLDAQLRGLSARLEAAREQERAGIAREIHDELGQALTAIKLDVAWVARRAAAPGSLDPLRDGVLDRARAAATMIDETIQRVRRISAALRPGVLDDLGLLAAIEWQAQEFERRTGTACVVWSNLDAAPLGRELSTALFRIYQEALTNVARYAEAARVEVRLERVDGALRLEVRDDGRGITPEQARSPQSLGLLGMRERARQLGGRAEVGPAPQGRGTIVRIEVPL